MNLLFDIDHTVSYAHRRDHLMPDNPRLMGAWDIYHTDAINDDPIIEIVRIVRATQLCKIPATAFTARPSSTRRLTEEWLRRHAIPFRQLLMRKDNDFRSSVEIKIELVKIFTESLVTSPRTIVVLEDRDDVTAALVNLGYTVLQVHVGKKVTPPWER